MLSGGIDSGSIVAVARTAAGGREPRAVAHLLGDLTGRRRRARDARHPRCLDDGRSRSHDRELRRSWTICCPTWSSSHGTRTSPSTGSMTLLRAVYLAARRRGLKMLLDGVGGDSVLTRRTPHSHACCARGAGAPPTVKLPGTIASGTAPSRPVVSSLRSARPAFVPEVVLRPLRRWRQRTTDRAEAAPLADRRGVRPADGRRRAPEDARCATRRPGPLSDGRARASASHLSPLPDGRTRTLRPGCGAPSAIEPRDPFLDLRVLSFCVSLPDGQMLADGWPKAILRRATAEPAAR